MPYATQKMVKYMKEKGMSSSNGGESTDSSIISSAEEKKKIRDLPSSVDPADDDDSSPKRSSSGSSLRKKSSTKKAKSKKAKSKKSKTKSRRGSSSSRKKSLVKPSSSGLKKKSSKSSSKRKFKMVANAELALAPLQEMGGVPGTANYDELTFDEKKVLFLKTLLTANIGKLKRTPATEPTEEGEQSFRLYSIDEEKPLWTGKPHSAKALYVATHQSFPPEIQVVCKQYDAKLYNPKSSLFLKVLRHLGKEHPSIIQTWNVVSKDDLVYVFQEIGPFGTLADLVKKKKAPLEEKDCQLVACQLRSGMDFLGDMGVSHRAIGPRHLLIVHRETQLRVKLTGFRSAVIYYNELKDEIIFQPCLPLKAARKNGVEDFNAPESYGNRKKEQFDPVAADVFSAGATLYHLLTGGEFPYDVSESNPEVEAEILKNVRAVPKLSHEGKSALAKMLTSTASKRHSVEQLKKHPWFEEK